MLALGLLRFRWLDRPNPSPPARTGTVKALAIVAIAFLLPILLIEEANPEWRLIQWTHAGQMVLVTFLYFYYAGGRRWARHFAFVVCFLMVAVPWPMPLEIFFVQNLMRLVAAITVEVVGLLNIPAVQHGNIIEISSGLVGVDEACSGVRSLQTAFFVCLFLGELFRFSWSRRFLLLVSGFVAALVCNVGRTSFLVVSAARHGLDSMHALHDFAGGAVLVITLFLIGVAALLLKKPITRPPFDAAQSSVLPRLLPITASASVLAWLVIAAGSTELWYRLHETMFVENAHWTAVWPEDPEKAQSLPMDSTVVAMLRCNEAKTGIWQDDLGNHWQAFFLRWSPGRNSSQLATAHTPEICLRGVGYHLSDDLGTRSLQLPNLELPFRQYIFSKDQVRLHVFYCRWEDQRPAGALGTTLREDGSQISRLEAVLAGRRHRGQQVLEVAIKGPDTSKEALAAFSKELPRLIRQ
jgi:exosortase